MTLRPYQQRIIDAITAGFKAEDGHRQLVVAPTGSGKTVMFSALAQAMQPGRTLILAHREELVDQAIQKLYKSTGILAGKEKAEFRASQRDAVVVASVQTMQRRLGKWPADHFALVVPDEAHHAISDSWQQVLTHFAPAKVVGFTATPDRGDKKNLGKYFQSIAADISLFELINQGWLSRISVKSVPLQIDLKEVQQTAGDYNVHDLGDALAPYLGSIAEAIKEEAAFRRTLVFVPLIATSKKFVEVCRAAGINAEHIDGMSDDRKDKLERFGRGEFDLLSNAMLLTEGFDDPGIDCVVILRPTRSRALYSQMVGRGTRTAPDKKNLLLLDFLWLHETHNLIRPAHLVAKSEEEAKDLTALAAAKPGGESQEEMDLEGLMSEVQVQREKKLREELERKAKARPKTVDAMEYCMLLLNDQHLTNYEPQHSWEYGKVTPAQSAVLLQAKIDPLTVTNTGMASKIIDSIVLRQRMNLATPRQLKYLRQFRHPHPETASITEASEFLGKHFNDKKLNSVNKSEFVYRRGFARKDAA
jgi:superfamily II DNA or RNA helicase